MIGAPLYVFFSGLFFFGGVQETAQSIMEKVAANQDRAETARAAFVYHSDVLLRFKRANGKLAREEYSEFTVTPTATGTRKERTKFLGRYTNKGKTIEYHEPGLNEHVRIDVDGQAMSHLAEDLTGDCNTKDGIALDLFPLTAKEQAKYNFRMEGTEEYRGIPVYRIAFEPKAGGNGDWAGEALIHRTEFQPALVTTHLPEKIPLVVRTVLGANVEHLGFKVTYQHFDDGLWFPVTYGGEMKIRVLFFYARTIGISMRNDGFRRAEVNSTINFSAN